MKAKHTPLKQKLLDGDDEPHQGSSGNGGGVGTAEMSRAIRAFQTSGGTSPSGLKNKTSAKSDVRFLGDEGGGEKYSALNEKLENDMKNEGYRWDFVLVLPHGKKVDEAMDKADELGVAYIPANEIINSLVNAGLQVMYYAKSGDSIICKIRAPVARLEAEATRTGYKIQMDSEELSIIGRRGVINPDGSNQYIIEPMDINEDPSISTYSPYEHIYASFNLEPRLTPLWRKAPGLEHPWKATHRIKLIMAIIGSTDIHGCGLELTKLTQSESVLAYYPPIDKGAVAWLDNNFFSAQLWEQPVDDMKEYLGEKIGLYFCFIGHYTYWLIPLAIGGGVEALDIIITAGMSDDFGAALGKPYSGIVYAMFVSFWAQFMLEYWKREQARKAMEWGMIGFEEEQRDRASYGLDPACEHIHSPVDGKAIVYFPSEEKSKRIRKSVRITFLLIALVIGCVGLVFFVKYEMVHSSDPNTQAAAGIVASILNAAQIQILNALYSEYAVQLNEQENPRTDTEYEDSLITKLFAFQFVNSYAPLFYIAFIKEQLGDECEYTCMAELSQTLTIIFITNVTVGNAGELAGPIIEQVKEWFGYSTEQMQAKDEKGPIERQYELEDYDTMMNLIEDYAELSIQYGYVTMFVTACPIAPLLAYGSNLVEIRVDGYNILHAHRRPIPSPNEDIGTWQDIFQTMSVLACVTNCAIVCFTMDVFDSLSLSTRLWLFITMQYFIFGAMAFFAYLVDDVPEEVEIQQKRGEFMVKTIVDLDLDEDDGVDDDAYTITEPTLAKDDDEVKKTQLRWKGSASAISMLNRTASGRSSGGKV
jgi:hypothetical protein